MTVLRGRRAPTLALLCLPGLAQAIDPSGTYRGTAVERIQCTDGGNGVRNLSTLMIVTGDDAGSFSAATTFTGTQVFNGVTTPFSNEASPFVGTVPADGSTNAQFQTSPPITTTGTLTGDTWRLGYVSLFGICTFILEWSSCATA